MTAHKHAALMLQYAQDAAETDKPWERWEYRPARDINTWSPATIRIKWLDMFEYRRKPGSVKSKTHTEEEVQEILGLWNKPCHREIAIRRILGVPAP